MRKITSLKLNRDHAIKLAAAAALVVLAGGKAALADVPVNSFETGTFNFAGDSGATVSQSQTTGVTDGSNSLHVQAAQSWWINFGYLSLAGSDVSSNTVLQFDVTTSTGVNFVPIFHSDPSPGPGDGGYYQYGSGINFPASASTQTFSFDYSQAGFNPWSPVTGLPTAGSFTLQLQGSTGNDVDFYIDNVRLTGAVPVLDTASGQWAKNGSGNWVDVANWNTTDPEPNRIPGAAGSQVTFGNNGGAITTADQIVVTVTQAVSAMNMTFDKDGGGYKIAGTFPVGISANVNVNSGSHLISAPLSVSPGTQFNIAANSTLTVDSLNVNGYNIVTKTGDGTLVTDKATNTSLAVDGGTWAFKPGNAQNNGYIYALFVNNGSHFNMNGAHLLTNSLYSSGAPGSIDLGTGGVLTTGLYTSDFTFFGGITGAGSVVVQGGRNTTDHTDEPPHTIGLAGSNSYSGTTTVSNYNSLAVGAAENLGDGSPTNYLILDNGSLLATGNFSSSRRVNITALGGTIDTGSFDVGVGVVDTGPLTKAGPGTLTVTRLDNVPTVNVAAGLLKVAPNGTTTGVSKIGNLTLAGGTSLDLTNNRLIATGSSLSAIQALVTASYAAGAWTGAGITSSSAAAVAADGSNSNKTALGYATAGDLGISSFGGQSVNPGDVLVRYVYSGDTNLDGVVNALDFNALASHFGAASTVWSRGDFNFDGTVTSADFTALAINFNQALPNPAPSLGALVPEPASMLLTALGAFLCARRRR